MVVCHIGYITLGLGITNLGISYKKYGYNGYSESESTNRISFNFGGGANVRLNDHFFLNSELILKRITDIDELIFIASLGVGFRF